MSDNKHHKRPASSSIPSAPLRFLPAYNAVWQAKCHFRQRWNTLTEHHPGHYGLHIHDLYLSLLGTPILGELVNELNLVLNEKVCVTSNNLARFLNVQFRENPVLIFLFAFLQINLYTACEIRLPSKQSRYVSR